MSRLRFALPALCLLAAVTGCGSARMLSYNADTGVGVVAIPSNVTFWPLSYRDDAAKLMAQKCPNGYDVVEEREAVVGQMTTTNQPAPGLSQTSVSDQTEYRITFRARPSAAPVVAAPPPGAAVAPPPGLPPRPVPISR